MYESFLEKFEVTSHIPTKKVDNKNYANLPVEFFHILKSLGGSTFNKGLYRLHTVESSNIWAKVISEYFEEYSNKLYPFGFDWMGRQFCLQKGTDLLLMFDPATGEDFSFRQTLSLLHNEDFVADTDNMLAEVLFNKIRDFYNIDKLNYDSCLGYKVPLFFGGKDSIENYELQDLEVYWILQSQFYRQSKNLPPGTEIGKIILRK